MEERVWTGTWLGENFRRWGNVSTSWGGVNTRVRVGNLNSAGRARRGLRGGLRAGGTPAFRDGEGEAGALDGGGGGGAAAVPRPPLGTGMTQAWPVGGRWSCRSRCCC